MGGCCSKKAKTREQSNHIDSAGLEMPEGHGGQMELLDEAGNKRSLAYGDGVPEPELGVLPAN